MVNFLIVLCTFIFSIIVGIIFTIINYKKWKDKNIYYLIWTSPIILLCVLIYLGCLL